MVVDLVDDILFVVEKFHELEFAELNDFLNLRFVNTTVAVNHAQSKLIKTDSGKSVLVIFELNYLLIPGIKEAV